MTVSPKIRVLVVDDSAAVRRIVGDAVSADPGMEVVGVAANGKACLEQLERLEVDVVTLDVEMPEMDGLATLRAIRRSKRLLPIIMFSALTERGARTTIEALTSGANDYLCKVGSGEGGPTNAVERVQLELLPRIKDLVAKSRRRLNNLAPLARPVASGAVRTRARPRPSRVDILAIGVSTGGPAALSELLPKLPADFALPVLLVQHMPPLFTRMLAERLSNQCPLTVEEAHSGQPIERGKIYIAPGDKHMKVSGDPRRARVVLVDGPLENGCRPAIDPLFRSVASVFGQRALALVLTGMGSDGLKGGRLIRDSGGHIWIQDEASSVVWGMPGAISHAGLADETMDLDEMAKALVDLASRSEAKRARLG